MDAEKFDVSADGYSYVLPTVTYRGSCGKLRTWAVKVSLFAEDGTVVALPDPVDAGGALPAGGYAEITVESSASGGKVRDVVPTKVSVGKNLGKKNATNYLTQAMRDALGMHNKKVKTVRTEDAAAAPAAAPVAAAAAAAAKPAAGLDRRPLPQLVKKIGETAAATLKASDFAAGVTIQTKLNGVRLVAYVEKGAVYRYSRTGDDYPGQERVAASIAAMDAAWRASPLRRTIGAIAADAVPYLDGELYLHGKSLNRIVGQARRADDCNDLEYHVFDVFFPLDIARGIDAPSRDRQAFLREYFAAAEAAGVAHPGMLRVAGVAVASMDEVNAFARDCLAKGYEGAIARKDAAGYQYGYNNYHSANLVKIKPKLDFEFTVVGFEQGRKGKDVGAVIWICETDKGEQFSVVPAGMTYEERRAVYEWIKKPVGGVTRFDSIVRGRPLTVEFAEWSAKTGKPLQAKGIAFRTYEAGPAADPLRTLAADAVADAMAAATAAK